MAVTAAIEFDSVAYAYPDGVKALAGVSFAVGPGECVGLVGPSGAGKSTLALALLGFIFPQQGRIRVDGIEVTKKDLRTVREKVGLIFQDPDNQLFMPTLFDDVAFGPLQHGIEGDELTRRVNAALAARGLLELADRFPGHLSGGQKRLAALAGVLVMGPQVLILDEPSSNLDPQARRALINHLGSLPNTRLIAGHDLEMILELCSRVILLDRGQVQADGEPDLILGDPRLMLGHGLEVPHSLLARAHTHDAPRRRAR